ncbi:MAG TPA: MarR family transcriptional regulator [Thermoplasmata archaeon]|nr:MarR family transcriptional regulator [Thermoplasmata archaeon]
MSRSARRRPPSAPPEPAPESPWATLRQAFFLFRQQWTEELARFDLTFSDFVVLDRLARAPAKASEVGQTIGITAAGATDLIDRLERRRLVRRLADPHDRRVVRVHLTPAGRRLRQDASSGKDAIVRYLDGAMTAAERRALADGLRALTRALGEDRGRVGRRS